MNQIELAVQLVQDGVAAQREADSFAIANRNPQVKAAGNAAVASALERLGALGVVTSVEPWFDETGIGFSYRTVVPDSIDRTQEAVARWVLGLLQPTATETAGAVMELESECRLAALNGTYAEDLLESIRELATCFDNQCYIACLALSGKILEIALKQLLLDAHIEFDDKWMIGKLLAVVAEREIPKYIDPSLRQVGEIINRSRIPAVHAVERIPVPSREQAAMVINAVIDTVRRTIVAP